MNGWLAAIDRADERRQRNQLILNRAALQSDKKFSEVWQLLNGEHP